MDWTRMEVMLERAQALGLDALALMPGPNLVYATGLSFHLSERPVIALFPVEGDPAVVLPALEAGKAEAAGLLAFPYTDEEGYALAFQGACAALELAEVRIGVEALRLRLFEARILKRYAPGVELVGCDELFSASRMAKDAAELAAMRRAVAVTETAFKAWLTQLRVGMTEKEAAARLVASLLTHGAEGLAFEPIIAGGPNAGLPHAVPGSRPFQRGDWVVVDWGGMVDGYAADLTRMVVFGPPQGKLAEIHAVVLAANEAGRAAVHPGTPAQAVDMATRRRIEMAGYGPAFCHRTGHGLGLEVHEPPYIVAGNELLLAPGMTFTVEPGIYLPELGGIRIEDNVVVTETGGETLSSLSRAPFIIEA